MSQEETVVIDQWRTVINGDSKSQVVKKARDDSREKRISMTNFDLWQGPHLAIIEDDDGPLIVESGIPGTFWHCHYMGYSNAKFALERVPEVERIVRSAYRGAIANGDFNRIKMATPERNVCPREARP